MVEKKLLKIGLDLGDTVFNRNVPKIEVGKGLAMQPCEDAIDIISNLESVGHELFVISKIGPGSEARVCVSLTHSGLVPKIISPSNVRFCFTRSEKGPILKEFKIDVHVDDRIEVLNAAHESGVINKILFVGVRDERSEKDSPAICFEGLHIAKNWKEVAEIIEKISLNQ